MSISDPAAIRKLVRSHRTWHHQIELAPDVTTPGSQPSRQVLGELDALGLPADASRLRVLDIGCRDGFFAFEMERRGAEVIGIDYASPEVTGFSIAASILGSRVQYLVENVYDLSPEKNGSFDLILCLGVLYHLRNPMLAFDRIRSACRPEARLFVETQLIADRSLRRSSRPLWRFFPRDSFEGDASNTWAPNLSGLRSVLEECEFEVSRASISEIRRDRGYMSARAVDDEKLRYFRVLDSSTGLWGA